MTARTAIGCALVLAGITAPASVTRADDADAGLLHATITCEHAAAPGRVRCDAELRAKGPWSVRWADLEVVKTPDFILPLKGRVGPREALMRESDLWRWGLGLVARDRGAGDVVTRVRAVVCDGDRCTPEEVTATARVAVGP